ncbi:MAG: cell division protein ZapE, partial [Pseudomonadota bacterium]
MPQHPLTPSAQYQQLVDSGEFEFDPAQAQVVQHFDRLYQTMLDSEATAPSLGSRLLSVFGRVESPAAPVGLYVWGGVGRGKTHLVDMFIDSLPIERKLRLHFHRFMRLVHDELNQLKEVSDPLESVAEHFAERTRILCLDEMQVTDITDAMLMAGLFKGLFDRGVALVTTSNIAPDDLYKDGLQRQRFVPAIELIKAHTEVVAMDGNTDYRLRALEKAEIYYSSLDADANARLESCFHSIAAVERHADSHSIIVNHRDIPVVMWADGIAWFEFDTLCNTARSKDD